MTTEPQVTHPPATHPETITPTAPTTPTEGTAKPAPRHAATRSARPAWRMPPPKVIAAVVLVAVALELLLWQVAGVFWGLLAHAILAVVVLVAAVFLVRRLRAQQRAALSAVRTLRKAAAPMAQSAGRAAGGPMSRLFRRSGRTASSTAGKRGGRSGGAGRGLFGRRSGAGGSTRGGLLGKLTGGRRSAGSAGRTSSGSGRGGSLLGRLGRKSASKPAAGGGATGRRSGVGAALGRMRSGGRSLLGRSRPSGTSAARTGTASSAAKRSLGGLFGRKASKPASKTASRNGVLSGLLRGVREGAQSKPAAKKPSPGPQHKATEAKPVSPVKAEAQKPQQPTKEQLVREAVQRAAKVKPAAAAPQRTGGNTVGDINKVRAAADEFAAALKDYDPETMHQLVREMPQFGEALSAIQQGFRQVASRAESEWPVAAPVAEGLRSIADDIKAGAGTAEETRGTIRRENETDIERGEAPRHGSLDVERKWNV